MEINLLDFYGFKRNLERLKDGGLFHFQKTNIDKLKMKHPKVTVVRFSKIKRFSRTLKQPSVCIRGKTVNS